MRKNIFRFLCLSLVASMMFVACGKDENTTGGGSSDPTPEIPTTYDLVHTSWQGTYSGTVQHPQAGSLPCILVWTIDLVDESNVSIMLEMTTGGQAQQPQEMNCTYSLDGLQGTLVSVEEGETQSDPFDIDPVNRTFTIDLRITTGFSQENPQIVGGPTVFRQIH